MDYVVLELQVFLVELGKLLLEGAIQSLEFLVLFHEKFRHGGQELLLNLHTELLQARLFAIPQLIQIAL